MQNSLTLGAHLPYLRSAVKKNISRGPALFPAAMLFAAFPAMSLADDAAEFADFMIEAMTPKPGPRIAQPMPLEAEQDLHTLAKLVFAAPHPPRFEDLEATVSAVMDPAVNGDSDRAPDWQNSQKRLVDAILKLVGHGAFRVDDSRYFAKPRQSVSKVAPSAQVRRAIWLVRLPELDVTGGNAAGCRDLQGLLNIPPAVRGIALDLRGTRGGDLFAVSCIANAFIAPDTPLFTAALPGQTLSFKSSAKVRPIPIDLPLVILIDRYTERRPLMLATTLRDRARAKLIGERPDEFDGTVLQEFRFGAFGEFLDRDKNDHDGVWMPMRIVMPVGEFYLPSGYPADAVLFVDVPVAANDERAVFKAAEHAVEDIEDWRKRQRAH